MRWVIGSWLFLTYKKALVILSLSLVLQCLLNAMGDGEELYRSYYSCCRLLFSAELIGDSPEGPCVTAALCYSADARARTPSLRAQWARANVRKEQKEASSVRYFLF